jgi:hypothetical protein
MAGIGFGVQLGFAGLARAQETPASIRPKEGDLLVKVDDHKAIPLTPDDIPLAADQTMAWAMDPVYKTIRSGERLNRMLPALPLKIVEKKLVVAGRFMARIYFEKD